MPVPAAPAGLSVPSHLQRVHDPGRAQEGPAGRRGEGPVAPAALQPAVPGRLRPGALAAC